MQEVKSPKRPMIFYYIIVLVAILCINFLLLPALEQRQVKEVDYGTFMTMIDEKQIDSVNIESNQIIFTDKSGDTVYKTGIIEDPDLVTRLHESGAKFSSEIIEPTSPIISFLMACFLPMLIMIALGQWLSKKMLSKMGGGMNSMQFGMGGKSNAKVYVKSSSGIKFSDVAGEDEAKELLSELVDYLHTPEKYREIGASMPKGALLVGPPGTGKTLLAKAVAGEANVPFFSLSGSDFVEMFVGMGAAKVRDLFKQANEKAPCIVFIDEIDAIGKKRNGQLSGNDEREQTLNQLLTGMDGFDGSKGVVILAATNQPDSLDPALLRPGRFDRRIPVELPDLQGRIDILKVHAKKIRVGDNVDYAAVAKAAAGASGAELANIVNEAALRAVRDNRKFVTQADMEESVEVVIAGKEKKDRILGEEEKKIVSYHEVGHAMAIAVQKNTEPVQKITIVPRTMGALGYTMQVPEEEKYLMSKEQMLSELVTLFGGRAAEEVVFNSVTTGASNDIERATQIARAMVTQYGMSERFGLMGLESVQNRYLDGRAVMNCSDATGALIDEEVKEMLKVAYDKAKKIIEDHREVMDEIAEFLIERETITGKEFMEIYNKSLKKDEPESVEEDKEKTELSEVETVSEESSLKDAESQDAQKVTEKKDSEEVKQEE